MVKGRQEHIARFVLLLILIGLPLAIFGYQYVLYPVLSQNRHLNIHMTAPESGGFSHDVIRIKTGETITLRFLADDVTHGIAIGSGLGIDLGAIDPGESKEVELTFDQPGAYTFYCTTWCSPNHWRMRGTIIVEDEGAQDQIPTPNIDPVIANLQSEGINIDAERTIYEPLQNQSLSLEKKMINLQDWTIPSELEDPFWKRTHTPADAVEMLSNVNPDRATQTVYDAVASLWLNKPIDETIDAQYLYEQNCAACHGDTGSGDGPGSAFTPVQPAAFHDAAYMFNLRSDVLYAKIRRGGMGTDMPNFGTIFTPQETWALVDYLWQLAFRNQETGSK